MRYRFVPLPAGERGYDGTVFSEPAHRSNDPWHVEEQAMAGGKKIWPIVRGAVTPAAQLAN